MGGQGSGRPNKSGINWANINEKKAYHLKYRRLILKVGERKPPKPCPHGLKASKCKLCNCDKSSKSYFSRTAYYRQKVFEFLGGKCIRCGFSDARALQIDHINGGGYRERLSRNYISFYRKILENPAPYQLLCANCNWIKRFENKEYKKPKIR